MFLFLRVSTVRTLFFLHIYVSLHAATLNMSKELFQLVSVKWINSGDFIFLFWSNVMVHDASVLYLFISLCCHCMSSCATMNVCFLAAFFQCHLLPCLQQIQTLIGMVRKEQNFYSRLLTIYFASLKVGFECFWLHVMYHFWYYVLVKMSHNMWSVT